MTGQSAARFVFPTGRAAAVEGSPAPGLWLLPALLSLAVLLLLGPEAFRPTVPANSDLTGHFLTMELLRTQLLPAGRIHGWTHASFAGFPLFYYYFPLPSVVGAALGYLLAPALALRLVVIAGLVALPWALYALGRLGKLGRAGTVGMVLVGSLFLLTKSQYALGGNLLSALAGEFSYSWSLALSVLYLGLVSRGSARERGIFPGVVLAAALLCHVLPAGMAALASSVGLGNGELRKKTLRSWVVAAGLTAFWTVPLALRMGYVGNRGWSFVPARADILPAELVLLLPAALLGLWLTRRNRALAMLAVAGAVSLATVMIPQEFVVRGHLIPLWTFSVYCLAGAGIGTAMASRRRALVGAGILATFPVVIFLKTRDLPDLRLFEHRVLEGVDAKEDAAEFQGLVDLLAQQPAGRTYFESTSESGRWGGPYASTLIPLTSEHTVLGGLLGESSPLLASVDEADDLLAADPPTPAFPRRGQEAAYNPVAGIRLIRELGVRYFVTTSEGTARAIEGLPGVRLLGSSGDFRLHDIGPAPLVLLEGGGEAPVHGLSVEPERIDFTTNAPGVPHLIRTSYFPNWRAEGADGPRPGAHSFMVVVPRSNEVTLEFRPTWVERLGTTLSLATLALLAISLRRPWKPREAAT